MAGFDWVQFRALFGAIRKGEERSDNGMGKSGGTSGTSRIVSLVFSFGMIAAMLLAGGLKLENIPNMPFLFHDGAIKYYQEQGIQMAEVAPGFSPS